MLVLSIEKSPAVPGICLLIVAIQRANIFSMPNTSFSFLMLFKGLFLFILNFNENRKKSDFFFKLPSQIVAFPPGPIATLTLESSLQESQFLQWLVYSVTELLLCL
jgi:hypothetical protein